MGHIDQRYSFLGEQSTKFLQIMSTLFESGLYGLRRSMGIFAMTTLRIRNKRDQSSGFENIKPIPGGLSGSLQTIFYIWAIGAAISLNLFAFEVLCRLKYKQFVTWVLNIPVLLRGVTLTVVLKFYKLKMKLRQIKTMKNVQIRRVRNKKLVSI